MESVNAKRSAGLLSSEVKILIALMLGKIDSCACSSTGQSGWFLPIRLGVRVPPGAPFIHGASLHLRTKGKSESGNRWPKVLFHFKSYVSQDIL